MANENAQQKPALLCISTYEKGQAFLREAAAQGCAVTLLTVDKLAHADWPWESLTAFQTMPEKLTAQQALVYVNRLMVRTKFERVVALDEFDLETAALAREHLQLPGMGETATRNFRDKLAMRGAARQGGVLVPEFFSVANHHALWEFMEASGGPWLLKPRWSASAIGIEKIERQDQVWPVLERLGDEASNHLLEAFRAGDIFHVDAVSWEGKILFAAAHQYGKPPMETMHEGGVFTTRRLPDDEAEAGGAARDSRAGPEGRWDAQRCDAFRVHSRARGRQVLLPGVGSARGVSVHRRGGRVREWHQSVEGMGAHRNGNSSRGGLLAAQDRGGGMQEA